MISTLNLDEKIILNNELKTKIINNLSEIINYDEKIWNDININIKLKIIHHFCNYFLNKNVNNNWDIIKIPLKNIRPKKLIQYAGFNKKHLTNLFNIYKNDILKYTFSYRNNYVKNNKYYSFNNLPKNEYNLIMNNYNNIVYNFLNSNLDVIEYKQLFQELVGNNKDKIIDNNINYNNFKISNIINNENNINILFNNNIEIKLELYLTSERITNNISAKYKISLINNF